MSLQHPLRPVERPQKAGLSRRLLLVAGVGALAAPALRAQGAYPTKPVTIVVPYPAGGASDVGARMLSTELGKALGQSVVVDNVGGAGGALGVQKFLRAPADGYTLLYGSLSETVLVPLINPAANYRLEDMSAIAFVGATPAAFVTRPDFPASSMSELLDLARKQPGTYSYGSPGIGTFQHLVAETVKLKSGTFLLHIPYRGGSNIMTDVVAGQIDVGVTTAPNVVGLVAQGRVKVLGVTSAARLPVLPKVPSLGETPALKGMDLQTWGVIFGPKGVPDSVQQTLNAAINAILMQPGMVEQRRKLGSTLDATLTPAQSQAFVLHERDTYRPAAGRVKPE
ncbi:MAG: tripartite tricarboxylate transporter substrate binding protein [Burkholderiaceae bacterium]|nr:tripartite tricarboxylate transporter substrate binding protein [Burkholderiaceae bacterium]